LDVFKEFRKQTEERKAFSLFQQGKIA